MSRFTLVPCLLALLVASSTLRADDQYDQAWIRYSQLDAQVVKEQFASLPAVVVALGDSAVVRSAQDELLRGFRAMLDRSLRADSKLPEESSIILGTYDVVAAALPAVGTLPETRDDGFWIRGVQVNGTRHLVVTAPNARGVLYGAFALLRRVALRQPIMDHSEQQSPAVPLRLVHQPDRLSGEVRCGLGAKSIFWEGGRAGSLPDRVRDYGRLLASVGINAIAINEPVEGAELLEPEGLAELAKTAELLRPWGLQVYVAIDETAIHGFAAGGADPGDGGAPLETAIEGVYQAIPDLGGFLVLGEPCSDVEADAESLDEARSKRIDAVNALGAKLEPRGGVVIFRPASAEGQGDKLLQDPLVALSKAAVNARAQLAENVFLELPALVSGSHLRQLPPPAFASVAGKPTAVELDFTLCGLGKHFHLVFMVPPWKSALDLDLKQGEKSSPIELLTAGGARSAFVGVANLGRESGWLRDPLAMSNLFGFGRLAWDPHLASKAIAEEWARLTFGHDALVVGTVVDLLLDSSQVFENYTGPLGLGALTGADGYGPDLEAAAALRFAKGMPIAADEATPKRLDDTGVGIDRTAVTGTALFGLFPPEAEAIFASPETCPPDFLLFLHHVPYTHRLKSGKTVIQSIYDALYAGAEGAARMANKWRGLEGKIDEARFQPILERLNYQAGHAEVWRDAAATWLARTSGIADDEGRVGNYPDRIEAEAMQLEGFEAKAIDPPEVASGGAYAISTAPTGKGSLTFRYDGEPGWVDLSVRYFDENDGATQFELHVAGEVVDQWLADAQLPGSEPKGSTSTRHVTRSIALRKGDEIRLQTVADGAERSGVDYIEIRIVKP